MRKLLGVVLPWVVAAGLLAFLFFKIPLGAVLAATRSAAWWMAPVAMVLLLGVWLADSYAIMRIFTWFLAPLRLRQILMVRGATYLLAAVNYNVGQAAILYFVHKVTGAPVWRGVGTLLLVLGTNLLVLLGLASGGLFLVDNPPSGLRTLVLVAYAGLAVYIVLVAAKPRWLRRWPILDVLLGAGLRGHLASMAVRLPHIAVLLVYNYALLHAFGVKVPINQAVLCLPVVFFVACLPISVQGLGTTQATMVLFFARYAPGDRTTAEAAVLAASLIAQALGVAFQSIIGFACLRSQTARQLRPGEPKQDANEDARVTASAKE